MIILKLYVAGYALGFTTYFLLRRLFITFSPAVANFFFPSQDKQVHKKHLEQALEKQLAIEKPKKTLVIKRWFPDFQQEKKP